MPARASSRVLPARLPLTGYFLESVILASVTLQLTYLSYLCITLLLCASQLSGTWKFLSFLLKNKDFNKAYYNIKRYLYLDIPKLINQESPSGPESAHPPPFASLFPPVSRTRHTPTHLHVSGLREPNYYQNFDHTLEN